MDQFRMTELQLPPGMHANGTLYNSAKRWRFGDKVRWRHGIAQAIGGWERLVTSSGNLDQVLNVPTDDLISRAGHVWRDNSGDTYFVIGHNEGLKAFNLGSTSVQDITPVGFTNRASGLSVVAGYGAGFYGSGFYGVGSPITLDEAVAFNWKFDNWGEYLLAGERVTPSRLYEWQLDLAGPTVAALLSNAPTSFDCFAVTPDRFVMMAGSALEQRLIQWSDQEDNNSWTPSITNQAGSQILAGHGRFKEIVQYKDQMLLVSQTDAYAARYVKPPFVYGFQKVGDQCGVESGAAVVSTHDFVVWPGKNNFFIYNGQVTVLDCAVLDYVKDFITGINASKVVGLHNSEFNEIWWFYQRGGDEIDSYVVWNYLENLWFTGSLDRTTAFGDKTFGGPFMMGSDGYIYNHEVDGAIPSDDDDPTDIYLESGPLFAGDFGRQQYLKSLVPDFEVTGSLNIYVYGRARPTADEVTFGPYNVPYPATTDQPVATRARGHAMRLKVEGEMGIFKVGPFLASVMQGGRK